MIIIIVQNFYFNCWCGFGSSFKKITSAKDLFSICQIVWRVLGFKPLFGEKPENFRIGIFNVAAGVAVSFKGLQNVRGYLSKWWFYQKACLILLGKQVANSYGNLHVYSLANHKYLIRPAYTLDVEWRSTYFNFHAIYRYVNFWRTLIQKHMLIFL